MECQEPNCGRPAKMVWNGRKVCADCYDKYRDQLDKIRRDMFGFH